MKIFNAAILAAVLPIAAYGTQFTYTNTTSDITDMAHGTATTWGLADTGTGSLEAAIASGQVVTGATITLTGIHDWESEPKDVLYINILNNVAANTTSQVTFDNNPDTTDTVYGEDPFVIGNNGVTTQQPNVEYATTSTGLKTVASPTSTAGQTLKFTGITTSGQASSLIVDPNKATNGDPGTFTETNGAVVAHDIITLSTANVALLEAYLQSDLAGGATAGDDLGLGFAADCHFYDTNIQITITTGPAVPDSGSTLLMIAAGLAAVAVFVMTGRKSRPAA